MFFYSFNIILYYCLFRFFLLGWGLFWRFWLTFRFPLWGIWSKNFKICQIPTPCRHSPHRTGFTLIGALYSIFEFRFEWHLSLYVGKNSSASIHIIQRYFGLFVVYFLTDLLVCVLVWQCPLAPLNNVIFKLWDWHDSHWHSWQPVELPLSNLHFLLIHSPHFLSISVVYQNTLMTYQNFLLH